MGRSGGGGGGEDGQQRALCFPTQRMVAWLAAWVLRHGTKRWAGFSSGKEPRLFPQPGLQRRVEGWQREYTQHSGESRARVYSVQRRVEGWQREYTRSQNPSYTPQTQNNICLWSQARSSVVTKWLADRYVLGFAPTPRAHSEHRFPAPSSKVGCRKPVLGVCPKSSPEQ